MLSWTAAFCLRNTQCYIHFDNTWIQNKLLLLISRPLLTCFVVKNRCFVRVENHFSHWGATFIRALSATTAGCSLCVCVCVCVVCTRCVNLFICAWLGFVVSFWHVAQVLFFWSANSAAKTCKTYFRKYPGTHTHRDRQQNNSWFVIVPQRFQSRVPNKINQTFNQHN